MPYFQLAGCDLAFGSTPAQLKALHCEAALTICPPPAGQAVNDVFIYGPNAVGAALGVVQLLLILLFPAIPG